MNQTLEILEKLISYPTVSSDSNLSLIAFVNHYLQERGFSVHQIDDPNGYKAGLFASIGPAEAGGMLLSGHTDVVPTTGQRWTQPDFKMTRIDDRVYGRGTTDMKGYLACMLSAADHAATQPLLRPLKLAFSYDEEIGCVGIKHMIDKLSSTIGLPEMAIVGEPTSMQVVTGHKAKASIRATCKGQAGHSALAPKFVNALHLAADFIVGLRDLQSQLAQSGARDENYCVPYSTVHVGELHGGTALNIVPGTAHIDFEIRHLAADNIDSLLALTERIAQGVSAHYRDRYAGADISLDMHNYYPGLQVEPDNSVITAVQRMAQCNSTTKVGFGTEAGYFHKLGIPTVVCGPGSMSAQGHKADEYISLEQLAACEAMMSEVVAELCH